MVARLHLGNIEDIVDQVQEMVPTLLHPLQHLADRFRHLAVDMVHDELGIAQDGVKGGTQLVAHVGEELRFMLASGLELAPLLGQLKGALFDLLLQAGVRFLELCRHMVERLGQGFQFVPTLDVDAVSRAPAPISAPPTCKVRMGVTTLRARNRLTSTASPRPRRSSTAWRSREA